MILYTNGFITVYVSRITDDKVYFRDIKTNEYFSLRKLDFHASFKQVK